jgi:hypothetical protein
MSVESDYQEDKYDHSVWVLITQCLLREESLDVESGANTIAGSLFQVVRALGLAPESLENLAETITGIIRTASGHSMHGGRPDWPIHIQLFCQRMLLEGLPHDEKQRLGGWGYYTIERGVDSVASICDTNHRIVEFYIYREGIDAV